MQMGLGGAAQKGQGAIQPHGAGAGHQFGLLPAIPRHGKAVLRMRLPQAGGAIDQDIDPLLRFDPRNGDDKPLPVAQQAGAKGRNVGGVEVGGGGNAKPDHPQLLQGYAADAGQILRRVMAGGDHKIAAPRDGAEGRDARRFGAVIGNCQRNAKPKPGQICHQRGRGFVRVDHVWPVGPQPAAQAQNGGAKVDQAAGNGPAIAGHIAGGQFQKARLGLRPAPHICRAPDGHMVPVLAQPIGQRQDMAGNSAHAQPGADLQHGQGPRWRGGGIHPATILVTVAVLLSCLPVPIRHASTTGGVFAARRCAITTFARLRRVAGAGLGAAAWEFCRFGLMDWPVKRGIFTCISE